MNKKNNNRFTYLMILTITSIVFSALMFIEQDRLSKSYSQLAYVRWAGKNSVSSYSQLSVFFEKTSGPRENSIKEIRNKISQKLNEDSLLHSEDNKGGRVWIDAYSTVITTAIRKDSETLNVEAYLVGGDFFQIHPVKLKSGNYPQDKKAQILLDEEVAWDLFGSNNIEGKKIWIGDKVYTVSGVASYDNSKLDHVAIGNKDTVYIPYDVYVDAQKKEDEEADKNQEINITCYEAVVPNPIKNYGLNTVAEANGITFLSDEETKKQRSTLIFDDKEIIDNSVRYKIDSLINRIKNRKYVDMRTNSIAYPYWENLARFEEARCIDLIYVGVLIILLFCIFVIKLVCSFVH